MKSLCRYWTEEWPARINRLPYSLTSAPPTQKPVTLQNVKLVFLPANTTATQPQPLDAGLVHNATHHLRGVLVRRLLADSFDRVKPTTRALPSAASSGVPHRCPPPDPQKEDGICPADDNLWCTPLNFIQ